MAVTGLVLIGFLLMHMYGNFKVFLLSLIHISEPTRPY